MTKYSKKIDLKYGVETYQQVKETIDWIFTSVDRLNDSFKQNYFEINYHINSISYTSDSVEDFCSNAFGTEDFHLSHLYTAFSNMNFGFSINIIFNEVIIDAIDKLLLEKICYSLDATDIKAETKETAGVINKYTINNSGNISNSIMGNNNDLNITTENKKHDSFVKGILQNLVSNIVWYILSAMIGAGVGVSILSFFMKK